MIGIAGLDAPLLDYFHREAAARGLETGRHWVIGLDPRHGQWARNAALMLMHPEPAKRPDGLIVSDDHFVAATTQGIHDSRVAVPQELEIVGLCNFTTKTHETALVTHLGFDVSEILRTCIRLLDAQRRGESVPAVTRIAPVFEPKSERVTSSV
jgi:DNA-binding LacI/PurR family transcriptional regulator